MSGLWNRRPLCQVYVAATLALELREANSVFLRYRFVIPADMLEELILDAVRIMQRAFCHVMC